MIEYRIALEEDYKNINDFRNRLYDSVRTMEEFYWEFHNCPYGKSIYVIAVDNNKIIGTNCIIPIDLITADNKIIRSGKSEDTLVDPDYRGQKIFYKIYDFLFEKCKEQGFQVIWGFTSAKKPFSKLGFSIPFDHQQSLMVNNVFQSYKFISSLNPKNKLVAKFKIFGLCTLSKLKTIGKLSNQISGYKVVIDEDIVDGVDKLIDSNLKKDNSLFAIRQNSEFQKWRIYQNPNYKKIHTYGFYNDSDELVALIVLNSNDAKIAYVIQSSFSNSLEDNEKVKILRFVSRKMFNYGVSIIRSWHFDTNVINLNEKEVFNKASYTVLDRGVGFVWKELEELNYKPEDFNLSRISTQGVI